MNGRFRVWALIRFRSTRLKPVAGEITIRPFCTAKNQSHKHTESDKTELEASWAHYNESYRQLQNLDLATAAKIAFTDPPKKKKFGLDFHLVQLFFTLLPSFAVYLVALYARREMRKYDAEVEARRKKEEEETARELELKEAAEREKVLSSPAFVEVKTRIDSLEKAVKEIALESKKRSGNEHETRDEKEKPVGTESNSAALEPVGKDSVVQQNSTEEKGPGRASEPSPR